MRKLICAAILLAAVHANPATAKPGETLCVSKAALRAGATVHERPEEQSPVVMTVGTGRAMISFGEHGAWTNVGVHRAGGIDGWIKSELLTKKDPDGMPCGR